MEGAKVLRWSSSVCVSSKVRAKLVARHSRIAGVPGIHHTDVPSLHHSQLLGVLGDGAILAWLLSRLS